MSDGFRGKYPAKEDDRHRIIVRADWRPLLTISEGERKRELAIFTRGPQKIIRVFSLENFQQLEAEIRKVSYYTKQGRMLRHKFLSEAYDCELDKQGRVVIPQFLREHAEIDGDIVIAGVGNSFEIWAKHIWDENELEIDELYEDAIEQLGLEYNLD